MWSILLLSLAGAQEIVGTEDAGQEFDESETTLSAELGGSITTGNTEVYNLSAGIVGSHKSGRNKLGLRASTLYGSSITDREQDGKVDDADRALGRETTSQRFDSELRYDRFLGDRVSLYILAGALIDRFAGFDLRTHEQIGVSYLAVDTDPTKLMLEFGFDWAQENFAGELDPDYQDVFAARLLAGLSHNFSESVGFTNTLELYPNVIDLEDFRLLNQAALSAKLSDKFSVRLSHDLTFDNQPVEGFVKLDQTSRVTIVASIL
ncbi:MAG: putative salt-induced outer membrane protein YdiY [Myxococcota bacterium]|jgi:putative salt-induced outer membrane protein YdiY